MKDFERVCISSPHAEELQEMIPTSPRSLIVQPEVRAPQFSSYIMLAGESLL